jgi:carboxyl-terminal processing protease
MTNSPVKVKALLFWLILGTLIGWQLNTAFAGPAAQISSNSTADEIDLNLFWDVWGQVHEDYVDAEEVDLKEVSYGAVRGLVDSLGDPYSVFMTPEETEAFQDDLKGELQGIGAELTIRDASLVVVSPLKNSPAEKAGLLPGDQVILVDGKPTADMTLLDAINAIRGEEGTSVTLTLLRNGVDDTLDKTIVREKIHVPSVDLSFDEINGKQIAHMEVYQFGDETVTEFNEATRQILLENPDGLILDLRLNGGGFLDASIEMMSEFFEESVTAVIVKRRNKQDEVMVTTGKGQLADIPMLVLIDSGSASASEILAGALQDYGRATLFGTQSFGKGSVQEFSSLKDGSSLRLTIAKWYTPKDRTIHEVGVTPDQIVEMDPSLVGSPDDIQYKAALEFFATQK